MQYTHEVHVIGRSIHIKKNKLIFLYKIETEHIFYILL